MKLRHLFLIMLVIPLFSVSAIAQETDYKTGYEKKMKECADTQKVIDGVVQWLKEHKYENYPTAQMKVEDALDQLAFAEDAKKKAEVFAAKGNWTQAVGWANQYWQYQVKIADSGLRAKQMIEEAEAAAKAK